MADFGAIDRPAAQGNYGSRYGTAVDCIVVHHTACTLDQAIQRFETPGTQVSAHFIVHQDGTVYQCVALSDAAYHSGNLPVNQRSVGIEHVSEPGGDHFTDAQYAASANLIQQIGAQFGFPIDSDHIKPHGLIVATQCPGALDVMRLIHEANSQEVEMLFLRDTSDGAEYLVDAAGKRHIGGPEAGAWAVKFVDTDPATIAAIPDVPDPTALDRATASVLAAISALPAAQSGDPQVLDLLRQIRAHLS